MKFTKWTSITLKGETTSGTKIIGPQQEKGNPSDNATGIVRDLWMWKMEDGSAVTYTPVLSSHKPSPLFGDLQDVIKGKESYRTM